jgi:hypothetical protein
MEATRWEYRVVVWKNFATGNLETLLNDLGIAGWELVTLSSTIKSLVNVTGNDMVAVLKRPSADPADRDHAERAGTPALPQFFPDPMGRHESRWWDGSEWTERVKDSGRESIDPI